MKNQIQKTIVVSSLFALIGALVVPAAAAAEEKMDAAARKAQREVEALKKYDVDHDGKLDPEEKAARKADRAKAKAEREAKKRGHAEPTPDGENR